MDGAHWMGLQVFFLYMSVSYNFIEHVFNNTCWTMLPWDIIHVRYISPPPPLALPASPFFFSFFLFLNFIIFFSFFRCVIAIANNNRRPADLATVIASLFFNLKSICKYLKSLKVFMSKIDYLSNKNIKNIKFFIFCNQLIQKIKNKKIKKMFLFDK